MSERMTLPVLPLRDFVLFPGVTTPINAGRPSTLRAIEAALATPGRLVFAVSQREDVKEVTPEHLYTIGTVARIVEAAESPDGRWALITVGSRRIRILEHGADGSHPDIVGHDDSPKAQFRTQQFLRYAPRQRCRT